MKKLISLIGALALAGCATTPKVIENISQETNLENYESVASKTLRKLGVPEELVNYQESPSRRNLVNIGGGLFGMQEYDTNLDSKPDVQEIYRITSQDSDGTYIGPEQPILYGFDFNHNGIFAEEGELIQDKAEDGLNGNEVWFILNLIKSL